MESSEERIHRETLDIARNLMKKDPSLKDWIIGKFPELAESEDEWIRKEIINSFKEKGDYRSCWMTWLEKQKPAEWSEEDKRISDAIYQSIDFLMLKEFGITEDEVVDWLKSHRPIRWKPTEKQIEVLERYLYGSPANENKEVLFSLYSDIKELQGATINDMIRKPKIGSRYLCIKDVDMTYEDGQYAFTAYYKNKPYPSENDECITDERGDFNHSWKGMKKVNEHFIPLSD